MCRPSRQQRFSYNGHERKHALKYQSVITPDGIVRHLHGPVPGTRHDAFLLATSTLRDEMRALPTSGSTRYIIYGDPAYSRNDCIISSFQGSTLNDDQLTFSKRMSKVRVSVEWVFGDVVRHWAFTDFVKKQKLHLQA
ncbi:TPA: hypothetical protein N0F65_006560, partial [Lagenidium giganteum]